MHVRWLMLIFSFCRWASLLWATEMSFLSPILAAVWRLAASRLASSSMACPSPFSSTSSLTTTPNWRSRSTHIRTPNAPSSSRNAWGASSTSASNPSQMNPRMRYTIGPMGGKLSTGARTERSCSVGHSLTLNGLITHGSRKCKTPSASNYESMWFKINSLSWVNGGNSKLR